MGVLLGEHSGSKELILTLELDVSLLKCVLNEQEEREEGGGGGQCVKIGMIQ